MSGNPLKQSGLSLVELLVSVAISLLIMVAILQLYLDISRTNDEMAKTNAQIENGRFTIQLLQDEIAHAGFWGGYVPPFDDLTSAAMPVGAPVLMPGTPRTSPDPCDQDIDTWTADEKDALVGIPIQVFDAALIGCSMSGKKADTDVLVARHAALSTGCDVDQPCFQTTFCSDDMPDYRLDEGPTTLLKARDCLTDTSADARGYVSNVYYIKDASGVPTLMRQAFGETSAQPLIEGIEGFKVELGIDDVSKTGDSVVYGEAVDFGDDPANRSTPANRGDGIPDSFVRCPTGGCSVEQLRNVVAVKLFVLVRNLRETPGYDDGKKYCLASACDSADLFTPAADERKYKRHLFTTTIRLNNVAGRRETP
ncbi:PilW family protein [Pseudomonas wenzhouensis]|nr:PilW family protein [Pseudomonas wenzhouensis]MDM9653339.1 PilW family protein [Pseudomonas wenzhouensis]